LIFFRERLIVVKNEGKRLRTQVEGLIIKGEENRIPSEKCLETKERGKSSALETGPSSLSVKPTIVTGAIRGNKREELARTVGENEGTLATY